MPWDLDLVSCIVQGRGHEEDGWNVVKNVCLKKYQNGQK